jgi:hypothetical protein
LENWHKCEQGAGSREPAPPLTPREESGREEAATTPPLAGWGAEPAPCSPLT